MRIGLGTPAFAGALAFAGAAAVLSAGVASAAPMTVEGLTQDFEPRISLVNGSYAPGPSVSNPTVRVGISGGTSNRVDANVMFFFPLRALNPGERVTSANLGFTQLVDTASVLPTANVDLYALGFTNTVPPANDTDASQRYFFAGGAQDPDAGGTGIVRTKIQEGLLVPADQAIAASTARQTNALGDAALAAYINSLYDNQATNGFVPGTSVLLLRLNYDADLDPTAQTAANRYTIASSDSTTADPHPTLTLEVVPEPGAAGLALGAAAMLLSRRRRK